MKTPIGNCEVDVRGRKVVHIVQDGRLILNQVIYPATIKDFMGEKGCLIRGWTFTTSIPEDLANKIQKQHNFLINMKEITVFPVEGGFHY